MYKKTIKYEDFNGVVRNEDFYFYLSKTQLTRLNSRIEGGIQDKFERIVNKLDVKQLVETVEDLILSAYGEKSEDGKRFIQTPEVRQSFEQTNAYDQLFMELINSPDGLADFIKKVLPQDLQIKIEEEQKKGNIPEIVPGEAKVIDVTPEKK